MTNRLAILLFLLIAAAIATDVFANDGRATLFTIRRLVDLTEYLAFWR